MNNHQTALQNLEETRRVQNTVQAIRRTFQSQNKQEPTTPNLSQLETELQQYIQWCESNETVVTESFKQQQIGTGARS